MRNSFGLGAFIYVIVPFMLGTSAAVYFVSQLIGKPVAGVATLLAAFAFTLRNQYYAYKRTGGEEVVQQFIEVLGGILLPALAVTYASGTLRP